MEAIPNQQILPLIIIESQVFPFPLIKLAAEMSKDGRN